MNECPELNLIVMGCGLLIENTTGPENWFLRKTVKFGWKRLKMELKDSNPDYKRWLLIVSRVIRIACILIKTLIPHKYSFEFCLGSWTMKIPTPFENENLFYLYGNPKMNLPTFWNSWECIRVLEIGYTSWKSRNSGWFLGSDCGPVLTL